MMIPRSCLKRFVAWPKLWWRSKGFGIHSPSAYEYVRTVVAERCAYYAYPQLEAQAKSAGMSRRTARLLMRCALHEGCMEVCCHGVRSGVRGIATAWSSDAKSAELPPDDCTMMVAGAEKPADKAILEATRRIMRSGGTIVLLDVNKPAGAAHTMFEQWLADEARPGVLMSDGRTALLHVVAGVPPQTYGMLL